MERSRSLMAIGHPPFWNLLAASVPLFVAVIGAMVVAGSGSGTGDYAGRLGAAVMFLIVLGGTCALGAVAAVVSLTRGEERQWLGVAALIVNFAVTLPIAAVLLRR